MSISERNTIPPVTRTAFIGLLTACALVAAVANALAADRVYLGNTLGIPLTASVEPGAAQTLSVLRQQVANRGTARVIVGVRAAFAPEGLMTAESVAQQRNDIATTQSVVLDKVPSLNARPEAIKRFETIPFMALEVTPAELETLASLLEITSIEEDQLAAPHLAESVPLIGGTTAWGSGYTGAGQTVAILDTGVDKTHPFLAGKVVSEACYSSRVPADGASPICPGGVTASTASGSAMPYASGVCPAGKCDHGTHVSGIAAGAGTSFSGVAKGASILAIQVFSRFDSVTFCGAGASPCALTYSSDQILGLERVYALRAAYNIAAVNMSLGSGSYSTQSTCDLVNGHTKTVIDNLRAANIATVISSGNDGYTNSMGAPGCISSAISVGATWDVAGQSATFPGVPCSDSNTTRDQVACYSNSAFFLNLLAPGSAITSSIPGGGYAVMHGTSMAAPHVTGAWALLKQKSAGITVADALNALSSTGLLVTDPRNGIVKPRIRIDAALAAIGGTLPSAPIIGTATAGNASVSVAFTPGALGSGTLINHTADCGGVAKTGGASPITVTGLTNGTSYTCRVKTTTTVGDSAWSGNSNSVTPSAGTLPDLVVTALAAPSTGTIGGQITISATVANQGTASAGSYRLGLYFSADATITSGDTLAASCNMPALAPATSQSCGGAPINIPPSLSPGTYYFGAFADDLGIVSESNEGNNTATTQITISAACAYTITPSNQALGAASVNGSIAISARTGCAWTAASNATWISITSGGSGSGNGTVIYSVAANATGSSRTGTITVAGNIFTVTQGTSNLTAIRNALFVNASTSGNKTSVVRLINTSSQSGAITATAYNEAGSTVGTNNLVIGTPAPRQMLGFTSAQLEAAIGYAPASPTAKYRVVFTGNLSSFEVINFIKDVATGNLTLGQAQVDNRAANTVATSTRNALFVNASTSTNKTSMLRLINLGGSSGSISATAYDEAGTQLGAGNAAIGTLAAQQMLSLTSAQLEAAIGFTPASPTAKYSIVFSANLNSFEVLNFIKDVATGSLTLGQIQID